MHTKTFNVNKVWRIYKQSLAWDGTAVCLKWIKNNMKQKMQQFYSIILSFSAWVCVSILFALEFDMPFHICCNAIILIFSVCYYNWVCKWRPWCISRDLYVHMWMILTNEQWNFNRMEVFSMLITSRRHSFENVIVCYSVYVYTIKQRI